MGQVQPQSWHLDAWGQRSGLGEGAAGVNVFTAAVHFGGTAAKTVRNIQRMRRRRAKFFRKSLFADPAWDMLLELYAAELEQRRVSIGSLCLASHVPATTGLRWIQTLVGEGLINKRSDRLDKRRIYVSLSRVGSRAMREYFDDATSELGCL